MIEDGKIYRRFDYKPGRKLPEGAIPCQEKGDPITGHFPHWVLCDENNPADKYHIAAFKKKAVWINGTYELIGKHFQSNPYDLEDDYLYKHGDFLLSTSLEDYYDSVNKYIEVCNINGESQTCIVPRTYEQIRDYLEKHYIEGIVFYRGNGEMCKIKRSDFGFEWNGRR